MSRTDSDTLPAARLWREKVHAPFTNDTTAANTPATAVRESVARTLTREAGASIVEIPSFDELVALAGSVSCFLLPAASSNFAHEVGSSTLDPTPVKRMPASA
jgi:hypothetical protein